MPFPIEATDERMRAITPHACFDCAAGHLGHEHHPIPRRILWPYVVAAFVALVAFLALLLMLPSDEAPTLTPGRASAVPAPSGPVTVPKVAGRNAADVSAELAALGLRNAMIVSPGGVFVTHPADWRAATVMPPAGSQVRPDAVVVVTVAPHG